MRKLSAFACGLLFGIGLLVSGMANPAKVLGFLDLAGNWDPSLAFVMAGAIAIAAPAFWLARTRTSSFAGAPIQLPTSRRIDGRLVGAREARVVLRDLHVVLVPRLMRRSTD